MVRRADFEHNPRFSFFLNMLNREITLKYNFKERKNREQGLQHYIPHSMNMRISPQIELLGMSEGEMI
jgi:hypothetical protein